MPAKTPPQLVNRLAGLIEQAMKDAELQAQLSAQGVTPVYEGPTALRNRMAHQMDRY